MNLGENGEDLPAGVTARLILLRHGATEAAAQGRCYGKLDVGLSPAGYEQAERAAALLSRQPLAAVYASPRRRASDTARRLAQPRGLAVTLREDLSELDFGDFEGLSYDEVARREPAFYRAWMERPTEAQFPNGESFAVMQARVLRAAAEIRRACAGSAAAIVAHGGTNRIILGDALRLAAADIFRLGQDYAGISVIDYYEDFPVVRLLNQIG